MTEQAGGHRTEGGTTGEPADAASPDTDGAATNASTESEATGSTETAQAEPPSGDDTSTTAASTQTRPRPSDDPPPNEAPTAQHRTPDTSTGAAPRGRDERSPLDVGELVWRIARILASAVRIVAYVIAVVLVAHVLLTIVGVNPLNAIAQVIGGVADATVLAFRDLFLLADPVFAVVVNYGLAAVFWVLVAEFGSRIIRWLGARFS